VLGLQACTTTPSFPLFTLSFSNIWPVINFKLITFTSLHHMFIQFLTHRGTTPKTVLEPTVTSGASHGFGWMLWMVSWMTFLWLFP
jgi:hypothetical protein